MANVLIYDEATGKCLQYIKSANTANYTSRADVLINPSMPSTDLKLVKVDTGAVVLKSGAELAADDAQDKLDNYQEYRDRNYLALTRRVNALVEQFKQLRDDAILTLTPEMEAIVTDFETVNAQYPSS